MASGHHILGSVLDERAAAGIFLPRHHDDSCLMMFFKLALVYKLRLKSITKMNTKKVPKIDERKRMAPLLKLTIKE